MADTTGWTPRNKENPWFAKANHTKLRKNQATKPLVDVPAPAAPEEET
jgi:hypothetical protein